MSRPTRTPDLESLRCFIEAARFLNFRAAAAAIGVTPAALGQRIRKLETRLDTELFDRTTRRVVLTTAGMALLPAANKTLEAAEECVRAAHGEGGPVPMEIVIGTRHELGMSWLLPSFPRLRERHPGATHHMFVSSGRDLLNQVRVGKIDCAITSTPLTDPKLDSFKLHPEDYVFVGSPQLLDREPLIGPQDARHHVLFDSNEHLPLFRYWRNAPGGSDSMRFGKLIYLGTISAIHQLVRLGEGVAVLPTYLVQPDLDAGRLITIQTHVQPLRDHFRLVFRADDLRRTVWSEMAEVLRAIPLS